MRSVGRFLESTRSIVIVVAFSSAAVLFFLSAVFGFLPGAVFTDAESAEAPHYDYKAEVVDVIDGDTVEVEILKERVPHRGIGLDSCKIRFVGVDTEELSQSRAASKHPSIGGMSQSAYEVTDFYREALKARKLVTEIIPPGSTVFLNVDELAGGFEPYRGPYGRIIALVFRENDGRWINVNGRVLRRVLSNNSDYTKVSYDYVSEFNPFKWLSEDYPYV